MWESTVVNLAHALRKLKRYSEAITYYEKALALSTRSLRTYAGLAYTYHLQLKQYRRNYQLMVFQGTSMLYKTVQKP